MPDATGTEDEASRATQVAWVTGGAYFNKKAQYDEMINAGYAPYRSNAYVVGLDVQRQEVLSTGEYSEWQGVVAGKAMPKLDLRINIALVRSQPKVPHGLAHVRGYPSAL